MLQPLAKFKLYHPCETMANNVVHLDGILNQLNSILLERFQFLLISCETENVANKIFVYKADVPSKMWVTCRIYCLLTVIPYAFYVWAQPSRCSDNKQPRRKVSSAEKEDCALERSGGRKVKPWQGRE